MNKFEKDCHTIVTGAAYEHKGPCPYKDCPGQMYATKDDSAVLGLIVTEDPNYDLRVWRTDGTHAHKGQRPEEIRLWVNAPKIAA